MPELHHCRRCKDIRQENAFCTCISIYFPPEIHSLLQDSSTCCSKFRLLHHCLGIADSCAHKTTCWQSTVCFHIHHAHVSRVNFWFLIQPGGEADRCELLRTVRMKGKRMKQHWLPWVCCLSRVWPEIGLKPVVKLFDKICVLWKWLRPGGFKVDKGFWSGYASIVGF